MTNPSNRPASIYSLTCGCTLLLLGSVTDVVGSRLMYLLGCFLQCAFTLACGLSKTATQLIVFRGFSGVAASFCLPSTVSIINNAFPAGRRRSLTFASMGGGLNFGFGIGLTLGGVWRNKVFTSICINVFLTWGAFNAFEQILSFFFQDVQRLSALQAALRFLPAPISGVLINLIMGLIIHRVRADWIVITAPIISCIAPLLMAIVNPQWLYWACAFPAIFLNPMAEGALFTTSNLLITSVFPEKRKLWQVVSSIQYHK